MRFVIAPIILTIIVLVLIIPVIIFSIINAIVPQHSTVYYICIMSHMIFFHFLLIEYVSECASEVCLCMKLPKTIGDSQKTIRFAERASGVFVV